jgi:hypothetical protein
MLLRGSGIIRNRRKHIPVPVDLDQFSTGNPEEPDIAVVVAGPDLA